MTGTAETWNILYRGSLSSCNYACSYCPFAKTTNTRSELVADRKQLERFASWLTQQAPRRLGVLLTPWGEALIREYYRDILTRVSHLPHVYRVAIQTNLSCELEWLHEVDREVLALWCTFHPEQSPRSEFVANCRRLDELAVRYCVGVVGLREYFHEIEALRKELDAGVYLWVNAQKKRADYYSAQDLCRLRAIDPYFDLNRHRYRSLGGACRGGETSFSVDGDGTVRRCHFIAKPLGNLYQDDVRSLLAQRACTNFECSCHIGYVHRPELELYDLFGSDVLNRIPRGWPAIDPRFTADPRCACGRTPGILAARVGQ